MIIIDDTTVSEQLQHAIEYFFMQTEYRIVEEASGQSLNEEYNPMAVRTFFEKGQIVDNTLFAFTLPLLHFCLDAHKLNIKTIHRCRVFHQPATVRKNDYLHDYKLHRDVPDKNDNFNFLYYCNDSDGGTFIYNEDQSDRNLRKFVEHKKGRFTIFDDKLWHAGSKPTKNSRLVLSVNISLRKT